MEGYAAGVGPLLQPGRPVEDAPEPASTISDSVLVERTVVRRRSGNSSGTPPVVGSVHQGEEAGPTRKNGGEAGLMHQHNTSIRNARLPRNLALVAARRQVGRKD